MRLRDGVSSRGGAPALLERRGLMATLGAAAVLCLYLALLALGGPSRASAALSAPPFMGYIAGSELSGTSIKDIAIDRTTGDIYSTENAAVDESSPYGAFILSFGKGVDKTKVALRNEEQANSEPVTVSAEEEDICTASSGDECTKGSFSAAAGGFKFAQGVAIEQSSGDVYVEDRLNRRIEKFTAGGRFLQSFGGFESWPLSGRNALAIGGPEGHERVYVAQNGRIDVFSTEGALQQELSLAPISTSPLADIAANAAGQVFFYFTQFTASGVHMAETNGAGELTLSNAVFDPNEKTLRIHAIGVDAAGNLYVTQSEPIGESEPVNVLIYEVGNPSVPAAAFGDSEPGALDSEAGTSAVNRLGTVYVADKGLQLYGSLSQMEAVYGSPPPVKPAIGAVSASSAFGEGAATLEVQVNPQWLRTKFQFEYGLAPCSSGGCAKAPASAAALDSLTKILDNIASTVVSRLQVGRTYHYRVTATNAGGSTQSAESTFTVYEGIPAAGPTGLPDSRVYEQVSPAYKNGNFFDPLSDLTFGLAAANGNAMLYPMSGPVGKAYTGLITEYVSRRLPGQGWQTESATPRQTSPAELMDSPLSMIPSASFSRFVFQSQAPFVAEDPLVGGIYSGVNIFLSESPAVEPTWLGKPTVSKPLPEVGGVGVNDYVVSGVSPELRTVYFAYKGTLTANDASRERYAALGLGGGPGPYSRADTPWGFYEWSGGDLVSAGELPNGTFSPWGAVPAAMAGMNDFARNAKALQAETFNNEVSTDGGRAFFVSPDPAASMVSDGGACGSEPPCTNEPPELYVREPGPGGAKVSVLVSRSQMPGHEGQPAPGGVTSMPDATTSAGGVGTDAYATPDGKHVFFASTDQLTTAAPSNAAEKVYEYNMETGIATYLPGVSGGIIAVSNDGTELLFEDRSSEPWRLKLWRSGANGGTVTEIAELPEFAPEGGVNGGHFSANGAVLIFRTSAHIRGNFTDGGGFAQIYRYVVGAGKLTCLSCALPKTTNTGSARISYNNREEGKPSGSNSVPVTTIETRGMSANGSRVFFDTPNALVPQDTNGVRDVYEWENGTVYLISSGSSSEEALYLDSDETGENVFFATPRGLVPGDTDEAYDVYDARIPRPGDSAPPSALPCKGANCQGSPSVPRLLSAPASESFSGPGNPVPPEGKYESHKKSGKLTREHKLHRALKACRYRYRHRAGTRLKCIRNARHRFSAEQSRSRRYGRGHGRRSGWRKGHVWHSGDHHGQQRRGK